MSMNTYDNTGKFFFVSEDNKIQKAFLKGYTQLEKGKSLVSLDYY